MIRIATTADVPLILQLLSELENPPYETEDSAREYLTHDVVLVDDEIGGVCSILRNDTYDMLRVRWLLPVSIGRARGGLLLAAALVAAAKRWPDMLDKRIEADFVQGKDATGVADGGQGECKAWRDYFGQVSGLKPNVGRSTVYGDDRWIIFWTLRAARDKIAKVLARV